MSTRRFKLTTLLVVLLVVAAPHLGRAGTAHPTPVIFSHDGDFDDMAALAYLARLHKVRQIDLRLVAVTYGGAALPGRGIRPPRCVPHLLAPMDIPLADSPATGPNLFPDLLRFTFEQVLTDVTPGCTASEAPSLVPAEQAIVNELERSVLPVTIIGTGPVTQIAGALQLRPPGSGRPIATRIERVYLETGAIDVRAGLCCGRESMFDDTTTFNAWADPDALQIMLDRLLPTQIAMVGAEATEHVPITTPFIARLNAEAVTPEAQFVTALANHPIITFAVAAGLPIFWWDPLAAVAATTRDMVDYRIRRIAVVLTGPSMGRTIEVGPRQGAWVRYAMDADQRRFEDAFLAGLNTALP